jgi:hypothetical protein
MANETSYGYSIGEMPQAENNHHYFFAFHQEVIAQRIDESVTGEFAKKRWLQMRDRYRKELKMALRTSVQPKWPYFTKLSWLDPYLKDAK